MATDEVSRTLHEAYEARALAYDEWTVNGKFVVRVLADLTSDTDTRARGISATLRWRQLPDTYRITLSNALGQGLLQLRGGPGAVTLRTAEGEVFEDTNAETLLRRQLGWSVPLEGLRYWVLGVADPREDVQHEELDGQGRLQLLEQSGWRIDYLDYDESPESAGLPTSISLSNQRLRASLDVNRWRL